MFSQCSSYDPLVGEILLPLLAGIPMANGRIMVTGGGGTAEVSGESPGFLLRSGRSGYSGNSANSVALCSILGTLCDALRRSGRSGRSVALRGAPWRSVALWVLWAL